MIESTPTKADPAGRDWDEHGVGRKGARRQRVDELLRHQRRESGRAVELQRVNDRPRGAFELKRRPVLLEHTAATARRQRFDPGQLTAAVFAETLVGRPTTGPAEWRDEQIERCAKDADESGRSVASQPAAVCDDPA